MRLRFGLIALLLWCGGLPAATIGDPQHAERLADQLQQAYATGERDLTIAPGTYQIPAGPKDPITFERWENAAIHAAHVTIIFGDQSHRKVRFDHCKRVTFEGAILRQETAPDTQGRVIAAGRDGDHAFCDWRVDDGYQVDLDILKSTFNLIDAGSRLLKVGAGDFGADSFERHDRTYRLRFRGEGPNLAVGDWLVTRAHGEGVVCQLDASREMTLSNITLENGGFGSFFETGGGSNRFLHCSVEPGPKPAGATEEPLLGCGADGFHSVDTTVGPDIEDCQFRGIFLDDCIAIHGSFQDVVAATPDSITVTNRGDLYAVGEAVRISSDKGFFASATATSLTPESGGRIKIGLDRAVNAPVGSKANNPFRCGRGFKIIRCALGNTRSRGILTKADEGVIEQCRIEDCGMSAISVGPEYYWKEANYSWNVRIERNLIRGCDRVNDDSNCAILIHGDGAIGNRDVKISDNLFDGNFGRYIIRLEWTQGGSVSENRFTDSFPQPVPKKPSLIHIDHARQIVVANNDFGTVPFTSAISLGDDVQEIERPVQH